jgi:hypothetical protein
MVAALPKFWLNFSMDGTTARNDSLNSSTITDNGTGDFTMSYTNNFNYSGYCTTHCMAGFNNDGHWDYDGGTYIVQTSDMRVKGYTQGTGIDARDVKNNNWSNIGDLA